MPDVINRQNLNRRVGDSSELEKFISDVTASLGLSSPSALDQLQASGEAERKAQAAGDQRAMFEAMMQSPMLGFGVGSVKNIIGAPNVMLRLGENRGISQGVIEKSIPELGLKRTEQLPKTTNAKREFDASIKHLDRSRNPSNDNPLGRMNMETGEIIPNIGGTISEKELIRMALSVQKKKRERGGNFLLSIEKKAGRVERAKQETKRLQKIEDDAFKQQSAASLEKRREGRRSFIRFLNTIPEDSRLRKDFKKISDSGFDVTFPAESTGENSLMVFPKGKSKGTPESPLLKIEKADIDFTVSGKLLSKMKLEKLTFEEAVSLVNRLLNPSGKGKSSIKSTILNELPKFPKSKLPEKVTQKFTDLGEAQRGDPERLMIKIQFKNGGGVLNPVVERAGDIINRMTKDIQFGTAQPDDVLSKVTTVLRGLKSGFGFEKEHKMNIQNNAKAEGINPTDLNQQVNKLLTKYAESFKKLPVYNRPQWLAREGAIAIGERKFSKAIPMYEELKELLKDPSRFESAASKFKIDLEGNLLTFLPD